MSDPSVANPIASPEETTTYAVTAAGAGGELARQTVTLVVAPVVEASSVTLKSFIRQGGGLIVRFDGIEIANAPAPTYLARVASSPYACSTWQGLPGSLLCSGPLDPQGTEAMVELLAGEDEQLLYSARHTFPICSTSSGSSGSGSGGPAPDPTPFVCPPLENCD